MPTEDVELLAVLKRLEHNSLHADEGELQNILSDADDYYMARAEGRLSPPKEDDQTSVVSHMLQETVHWTKPELVRMFIAGPPVSFTPTGPEDVEAAERETKIVNHVICKQNSGMLLYDQWFQDALVQRNGYVYAEWDEHEDVRFEEYESLTGEQLLQLQVSADVAGEELEFVSQEDNEDGTVSVEIKVTGQKGFTRIDNCPPEDMRIAADAGMSLQEASFVAQILRPTRSDLIAAGYDRDVVMGLPKMQEQGGASRGSSTEPGLQRNQVEDEDQVFEIDKMMQQVRVMRAFVRMDYDDDGFAELRKIVYHESEILENEPAPLITYAHITPFIRSHRHIGLSFYDLMADLQEMDTLLLRQLMDNTFGANHNALAVNDMAVIDYDDFLIPRPNPLYRLQGSPQANMTVVARDVVSHRLIPIREHIDMMREQRTGVGRTSQGLNPDVLQNSTADAFNRGLTASSTIREGIARVFAETGVKDLMLIVQRLMIEHQSQDQMILLTTSAKPLDLLALRLLPPAERLARLREAGWEISDPRRWKHRRDMTANVGLGHNTKQDERQGLMMLKQVQMEAVQGGSRTVQDNNVFALEEDMVKAFGMSAAKGRYFTDPTTLPPEQPQENPLVTIQKLKNQGRMEAEALKGQIDTIDQMRDLSWQQRQAMINALVQITIAELQTGTQVRQQDLQADAAVLSLISSQPGDANASTETVNTGGASNQGPAGPGGPQIAGG